MTLRLATDETLLSHGGNTVRLRPSLRAATLLHQRHGFGWTVEGLQTAKLDIVLSIVDVTADDPQAARALITQRIADKGTISLAGFIEPLFQLVADCFGVDPDAEHPTERDQPDPRKPLDFGKALTDLYELGTGWLEWSPADAWSATPAEIMAAHRGLIAKLRAIHDAGEDQDKPAFDPREEVSDDQVKAGLAKLRANAMRGRAA